MFILYLLTNGFNAGMITDLTYLKSLANDDESFIRDMINIFKEQIEEYKIQMPELLVNSDYNSLSKMAHKAKSSVAVMGMAAEAEKLKELEALARNSKETERYEEMVRHFLRKSGEAIAELDAAYP